MRPRFLNKFMVSLTSYKSLSIRHDFHFVNYDPIYSKKDIKAGYALGCGYLMTDKLLLQYLLGFTSRSNQDIFSSSDLFSKYGYFSKKQKNKMVTTIMPNLGIPISSPPISG